VQPASFGGRANLGAVMFVDTTACGGCFAKNRRQDLSISKPEGSAVELVLGNDSFLGGLMTHMLFGIACRRFRSAHFICGRCATVGLGRSTNILSAKEMCLVQRQPHFRVASPRSLLFTADPLSCYPKFLALTLH